MFTAQHIYALNAQPNPDALTATHIHVLASLIPPAMPNGEIQLFPDGVVKPFYAGDTRGPWLMDEATAEALIAEFDSRGGDLALDYEHQTLHAASNGKPAPAAGWIKQLIWRAGSGLFAAVEWTAAASAAIKAKEYRYISPVFASVGKRITSLMPSALTNNPALVGMAHAIAASAANSGAFAPATPQGNSPQGTPPQGTPKKGTMKMDELLKKLRAMLGLPDDADEAAIAAALDKYQTDMQAMQAKAANAMTADPSKFIALTAFEALKAEFVALNAKIVGNEVAGVVDAALACGKLLPAQKAWALDLGKQNIASLTAYIASAPQIAALSATQTGGNAPAGTEIVTALTADEQMVAQQFGFTAETAAKLKGAK